MTNFKELVDFMKQTIAEEMVSLAGSIVRGSYDSYERYKSACSKYAAYNHSIDMMEECLKKVLGVKVKSEKEEGEYEH